MIIISDAEKICKYIMNPWKVKMEQEIIGKKYYTIIMNNEIFFSAIHEITKNSGIYKR